MDSNLLPRINEGIISLAGARVFSTLDGSSGYRKIEVDEEDRDKTAFASNCGLFHFLCMLFILKNTPGTFQLVTNIIFTTEKLQFFLYYLDEIIIIWNSLSEDVKHVWKLLHILSDAGLSFKLNKCLCFTDSINYLQHSIRTGN